MGGQSNVLIILLLCYNLIINILIGFKTPTPKGEPSVLNHKSVAFSPIKTGDLLHHSGYFISVILRKRTGN